MKHIDFVLCISLLLNLLLLIVCAVYLWRSRSHLRYRERMMGSALTTEEIFAQLPGNVYWKNRGGILVEGNKTHSHAYSKLDDLRGVSDYDLFPKEQADKIRVTDREIMRTGQARIVEEEATSVDGKTILYLSYKAPLRNAKKEIVGVIGTSLDITDAKKSEMDRLSQEITKLKEAEQALQAAKELAEKANHAKSSFIAVVSHELRTPLTGVLGVLEILRSESLPEEKKVEYLESVDAAARYLLSLINNILDFAKLDADKFHLAKIQFNLLQTIKDALKILEFQAENKKIQLSVDYPSHLPQKFTGDAKALSQILLNILSNAVKFTEQGTIRVAVEEKARTQSRVDLLIKIEDTGVGVPAEKLEKIFEAFEQVDTSHTREHGGTGLGLAVTRRLVNLMGGDISVESVVNQGTKFSLSLTFDIDASEGVLSAQTEKHHQAEQKKSVYRILLVEDDHLVQFVHQHKLEKLGCQVTVANNAAEALAEFSAHKFDLILMDIGLPDLSGNEVIERMRSREKDLTTRTPIIALTAYSDQENHDKTLEVGANAIVCKPVESDKLKEVLETYIRNTNPALPGQEALNLSSWVKQRSSS